MIGQVAVQRELMVFLSACGFGACVGLLYDCFRILRLAIPFGPLVVFIQDAFFWGIAGVGTFLFTYALNAGEVRAFLLLGELTGAVLYFLSVSRIIMRLSGFIIRLIKKLFRLIFSIIIRPVAWIFRKIGAILGFARKKSGSFSKKVCQNAKYSLKAMGTLVYNLKVKKNRNPESAFTGRKKSGNSSIR